MSESGVHAHAPHEEALHHASLGHSPTLNQWVAVFTALLAALGAVVSYQGSRLMEEVLLYKNEAVLKKTHATDAWNYYQAVSTKQHLTELALALTPPAQHRELEAKIVKYKAQKEQVQAEARAMDAASAEANARSTALDRPHIAIQRALIALQIAISLASITALTGRRWLFGAAIFSAVIGIGIWAMAEGWAI